MGTNYTRVSRDFLRKFAYRFVRRSVNYYLETEDHIFTYREKQLHSIVCPSIADVTSSYMMEHPLTRKPASEEEFQGHADYWISYRNYSFLLELKHGYFAYGRVNNLRQSLTDKFISAMDQLKSVRKDECRNLTINKGLVKIAIEAIAFYEGSKSLISKDDLKNRNFKELFNRLLTNTRLDNKANFRALWMLNENLVKPVEYINSFDIYPVLAFIGNISEMV